MPGTKATAVTSKARYGEDYYARIGAIGGKLGRTGGFFANRELASLAGAKGGRISRRGPSKRKDNLKVALRHIYEGKSMKIIVTRKLVLYYIRIVGRNGEVLLTSETYYSKSNAKRAAMRLAEEFQLDMEVK